MERKHFLKYAGSLGIVTLSTSLVSFKRPDKEKLNPALVQEFVGASHKDMDKVKELLEAHPTLLNAAHDWNRGDFETGLGAASHVGYKELARYLIDMGAQTNIFTACLFGEIETVKLVLKSFPKTIRAKGPHGFTLLHHAEKGGADALEVKEYLMQLGAIEKRIALY